MSEGKIIEIYNQGLTQVMCVIKELTTEIKVLNSCINFFIHAFLTLFLNFVILLFAIIYINYCYIKNFLEILYL